MPVPELTTIMMARLVRRAANWVGWGGLGWGVGEMWWLVRVPRSYLGEDDGKCHCCRSRDIDGIDSKGREEELLSEVEGEELDSHAVGMAGG